jgi:hypothetical protein
MISLIGKSIGWIITSVLGLTVAVGAYALNKADSTGHFIGIKLPISLPNFPPQHQTPPAVPEVNTGLVLLPIVLAVLLFTSRQLWRRRGVENQ